MKPYIKVTKNQMYIPKWWFSLLKARLKVTELLLILVSKITPVKMEIKLKDMK